MSVVRSPASMAVTVLSVFGCALLGAMGCGPAPSRPPVGSASLPKAAAVADEHDHGTHHHDHDEPESLADGVEKLGSLTKDLAEKLADNAGEAADDAVHEIGHLLEELRDWAQKEGFEGDAATAATKAIDELEECFGKVDEAFHSGDDKADPPAKVLESVKERLDAAFRSLKATMASKEVK